VKKFILRTFTFTVIFIIILVVKSWVLPYYIGNPSYGVKLKYYKKNNLSFNSVVFGSSRLYRQVNSVLLDSLLKNHNLSTYNFATAGAYNPESYYIYEKFIQDIGVDKIKYAFLELQSLDYIGLSKNIKTSRGSYWNTFRILNYSFGYINNSTISASEKIKIKKIYLSSFVYGLFEVKHIFNLFRFNNPNKGINGYYPLDLEVKDSVDFEIRESLLASSIDWLSDTTKVFERIDAAKKMNSIEYSSLSINHIHQSYLEKLIAESKKKGIHLFIVLPPRLTSESYQELVPVIKALPQGNAIELASYTSYSKLYLAENSFDIGHLNSRGANIFTTFLAKKTDEKLILNKE